MLDVVSKLNQNAVFGWRMIDHNVRYVGEDREHQ